MKVYMNRSPVNGPWGGGNRTVIALADELVKQGHEVTFDINDRYDVIYCRRS